MFTLHPEDKQWNHRKSIFETSWSTGAGGDPHHADCNPLPQSASDNVTSSRRHCSHHQDNEQTHVLSPGSNPHLCVLPHKKLETTMMSGQGKIVRPNQRMCRGLNDSKDQKGINHFPVKMLPKLGATPIKLLLPHIVYKTDVLLRKASRLKYKSGNPRNLVKETTLQRKFE